MEDPFERAFFAFGLIGLGFWLAMLLWLIVATCVNDDKDEDG